MAFGEAVVSYIIVKVIGSHALSNKPSQYTLPMKRSTAHVRSIHLAMCGKYHLTSLLFAKFMQL